MFSKNSSCHCIRFPALKLQVCFGSITATGSLAANGGWYTGNLTNISNGTFARPFQTLYSVQITQGASDWVAILRKDVSYSAITAIVAGYLKSYTNAAFKFDYVAWGSYE